jgi:CheY-like chemotaxis protein/anti-sigma regulatory factor (Ser/Thr protein kinase)
VESSQPLIVAARHEFECDIPAEPIELEGDPNRLAQVVSNLLNNAAKYTPEGGRIRLTAERRGDQVVISVTDTGIGIPVELQKSVFNMFTQSKHPLDKDVQGLGIGLSLSKSLVEMHQGSIEVRSDGAGKGSEFRVSLPIAARTPTADSPTQLEPNAPASRKGRVLVVDDNQAAAQMLAALAEMLGHEVRVAYSGREGVQAAKDFRPELVFMDLGMADVNGFDAAREIRQQPWGQGIRLVALTGWGQDEDRQRTKEFGFDLHLVKPATTEDLQQAFRLLDPTRSIL